MEYSIVQKSVPDSLGGAKIRQNLTDRVDYVMLRATEVAVV